MSFQTDKRVDPNTFASIAEKLISKRLKNVVTIAGAGISTSAGISDCRSPVSGLYNKLRKYKLQFADVMWDKKYFLSQPEKLYSVLKDNFLKNPLKPTVTHCFIKLLENKGVLLRHFTQNIDGMELMTGLSPDKVVEAHGTLQRSYCVSCKQEYNYQWLVKKIDENPVPFCESCGGLVRPDVVLFGERLSQDFDLRAFVDVPQCDLLIILGTSLQVEPFASIINNIPTTCPRLIVSRGALSELKSPWCQKLRGYERDVDDKLGFDTFIMGDCDSVVIGIVKQLGWEDDLHKVIRDVKLRKLYGGAISIDVGVQTAFQYDRESLDFGFSRDSSGEQLLKCADFRTRPKPKTTSVTTAFQTLVKMKPPTSV